jgi:hypothetical protein
MISSFTIETDSFVVSKNKALAPAPIMQVLLNTPVKLYHWQAEIINWPVLAFGAIGGIIAGAPGVGMSGGSDAYFYGPDPERLNILTRKNFIQVLSDIMADKPELAEKIKNKKFRYRDMKDLQVFYTTGKLPEKPNEDVYN